MLIGDLHAVAERLEVDEIKTMAVISFEHFNMLEARRSIWEKPESKHLRLFGAFYDFVKFGVDNFIAIFGTYLMLPHALELTLFARK